ncbi:MAG: hypothetical protein NTY38_30825 [Acidobacteria bacterium]|nr:hypothetical protein [Acidobacteriota bacterium]
MATVAQIEFAAEGQGIRVRSVAMDGTSLSSYIYLRSYAGATP